MTEKALICAGRGFDPVLRERSPAFQSLLGQKRTVESKPALSTSLSSKYSGAMIIVESIVSLVAASALSSSKWSSAFLPAP